MLLELFIIFVSMKNQVHAATAAHYVHHAIFKIFFFGFLKTKIVLAESVRDAVMRQVQSTFRSRDVFGRTSLKILN